jgi:hypothetical protein
MVLHPLAQKNLLPVCPGNSATSGLVYAAQNSGLGMFQFGM